MTTTDDHGGDHGHDDLGHDVAMPLGPLDVFAWGAGLLGIALGLAVVAAFAIATGGAA
jgi:hypothetical protein